MKKSKLTRDHFLESFKSLENRANLGFDFLFLTIAAAAICSFGFRMNSPSVIVGAMVISPLLFVIVNISSAIFSQKWSMLIDSLITLSIGIAAAILVSLLINVISTTPTGTEIAERITSNPVDYFFVALFSGLAGTFAFFWPEVQEAIAGIAISVALIPPVVMIGIGLANSNGSLVNDSISIVIINVIGIIFGSIIMIGILNLFIARDR